MRARVKTAEVITGVKMMADFTLFNSYRYFSFYNVIGTIEVEECKETYDFKDIKGNYYLKSWLEFLPEPDLKMDAKVLVWHNYDVGKYKRHFAGKFSGDGGEIGCWPDGKTSWSVDRAKDIQYWNNWEVVEDDENKKS